MGGYMARFGRVRRVSDDGDFTRGSVDGVCPDGAGAHVGGVEVAA